MTTQHNLLNGKCFEHEIKEISEICDHEYYMGALGSPVGSRKRAEKSITIMAKKLVKLENLKFIIQCSGCFIELKLQLELQNKALVTIKNIWNL